jgi:hypothetical protein
MLLKNLKSALVETSLHELTQVGTNREVPSDHKKIINSG